MELKYNIFIVSITLVSLLTTALFFGNYVHLSLHFGSQWKSISLVFSFVTGFAITFFALKQNAIFWTLSGILLAIVGLLMYNSIEDLKLNNYLVFILLVLLLTRLKPVLKLN